MEGFVLGREKLGPKVVSVSSVLSGFSVIRDCPMLVRATKCRTFLDSSFTLERITCHNLTLFIYVLSFSFSFRISFLVILLFPSSFLTSDF